MGRQSHKCPFSIIIARISQRILRVGEMVCRAALLERQVGPKRLRKKQRRRLHWGAGGDQPKCGKPVLHGSNQAQRGLMLSFAQGWVLSKPPPLACARGDYIAALISIHQLVSQGSNRSNPQAPPASRANPGRQLLLNFDLE